MVEEVKVAEEPQGSDPVVDEEVPEVKEEAPERPDFLDPRFKTVEEQAKAYREAEKMATQKAQRAADLERELQMRQMREAQTPQTAQEQDENLDEAFWHKPTEVISKVVQRHLDRVTKPIEEDRFNSQKAKYAQNEDFKRYEPQIDEVFKLQPHLKNQPGAIDYVYNFLRAQNFNADEERQRIEAKVRSEFAGTSKKQGGLEAGSPPVDFKPTPKIELNEEERRAALRFYSELPPQEAYKRYHTSKMKWSSERSA